MSELDKIMTVIFPNDNLLQKIHPDRKLIERILWDLENSSHDSGYKDGVNDVKDNPEKYGVKTAEYH